MTRFPTLAAIDAAELRLFQSRRKLLQSVERTRSALRTAVARPSTLALVALASGGSAFLLARWARPSAKRVSNSADSSIGTSTRRLVRAFVSMYGAGLLGHLVQHGAAVWQQIAAFVSKKRHDYDYQNRRKPKTAAEK